jgi:hypothetical protein
LYLLPWKFAALFQVATAIAVLHWFARFPCFLPTTEEGGAGSSLPWQLRAAQACSNMQSYSALLRTALGTPLSEFSQNACSQESGMDALEVLQVFSTLVCLVLIPTVVVFEIERWMRLRYQQQQTPPSSASGGSSFSSTSSAGSSAGSSHSAAAAAAGSSSNNSLTSGASTAHPRRDINSLSMAELQQLTEADGNPAGASALGHAAMLVFVMLLVVPALWLLSEALAEMFAANRNCEAVLATSQ